MRAAVAAQLLNEMQAGNISAEIARAADFYGPGGVKTSVPNLLVFSNLAKGKKAQWLGNVDLPHTYTYVPDAASALYLLATGKMLLAKPGISLQLITRLRSGRLYRKQPGL